MSNERKADFKFTGGDNFTGIHQLYHEVMMRNELKKGYGAYEVTYAGGNSGISFGGNQMDMKENQRIAKIFVEILIHATDNAGHSIFTKDEVTLIAGDKNLNLIGSEKSVQSILAIILLVSMPPYQVTMVELRLMQPMWLK